MGDCNELLQVDINKAICKLESILQLCGDQTGGRFTFPHRRQVQQPPWFDQECNKLKSEKSVPKAQVYS